jgi:hypothetical protein
LCVDPADNEHEEGSVTIVEPGLMRGHLNSFCYADVGSKFDIDNWQKICRRAFTIWQAAKRPPIKEREEPAGVH